MSNSAPRIPSPLLPLAATLSWGAMFPIAAHVLRRVDPVNLTAVRYGVATLGFLAILWFVEGRGALRFEGRFGVALRPGDDRLRGVQPARLPGPRAHRAAERGDHRARRCRWPPPSCAGRATASVRPASRWPRSPWRSSAPGLVVTRGQLSTGWGIGDLYVFAGMLGWVLYTSGAANHPELSPLRYTALSAVGGTLSILAIAAALDLTGGADAADRRRPRRGVAGHRLRRRVRRAGRRRRLERGRPAPGRGQRGAVHESVPVTAFAIRIAGGYRPGRRRARRRRARDRRAGRVEPGAAASGGRGQVADRLGPELPLSSAGDAGVPPRPDLHPRRRPAQGDRRDRRQRERRRALHDAARRHGHRQDDDDGGHDRAPAEAGARPGPQQDARRAAVQRVPHVLPRHRGRVLRLLLRLLPARGLRPLEGPLHREGLGHQPGGRPPAPRRDRGAVRPPRRDHRGQRCRRSSASARRETYDDNLQVLRKGDDDRPRRAAAQARLDPVHAQRHRARAAARSGCAARRWRSSPPTRRPPTARRCSATRSSACSTSTRSPAS